MNHGLNHVMCHAIRFTELSSIYFELEGWWHGCARGGFRVMVQLNFV